MSSKQTGLARRVSTLLKRAGVRTQHPELNRDGVTVQADSHGATVRASYVERLDHMDELVELMERTLADQGYQVRVVHPKDPKDMGHAAFLYVRRG